MKAYGNIVDCGFVADFYYGFGRNIAEKRDFVLHALIHRMTRAAHKHVGQNAYPPQFLDTVLCGLGLEFLRGLKVRNQRNMTVNDILTPRTDCHLPYRLKKRLTLNVAYSAADFHDKHIKPLACTDNALLNVVSDVRDYLNCSAQVIAPPLFLYHAGIYFPGCDGVLLAECLVNETLVMA